jgi:hypothetical protein
MGEGFHVAASSRALVVDGRDFRSGSFIARVDRNSVALHERIDALSREAGVSVYAAASAFPDRGPTGTGSEATRTLNPPRIAVLAGEGINITSYGALWFQLERRIAQPFTALRGSEVSASGLDRFDVMILPDGNPGGALGPNGARNLRGWVERGGTLIAYGGSARWVQSQDLGLSFQPADTAAAPRDTVNAILQRIDATLPGLTFGEPAPGARPNDPQAVPGSFLRARIDTLHWLSFGVERAEQAVLVRTLPLRPTLRGANVIQFAPADRLVVAGFTWPDNTARTYAGRPYATVDRAEDGTVILIAGDPLHRGIFDAPGLFLMNAIYLGARGRPGSEGGR